MTRRAEKRSAFRLSRSPLLALGLSLAIGHASAAPPPVSIPLGPDDYQNGRPSGGPFDFLSGLRRSNYLLGDMWGLRTWLSRYGISLALQETSEGLGNATGGVRRGVAYDGLTQAVLQMDTQRAFGLYGGTFNVSGLQTHGRNLSAEKLATLQTESGIEADRSLRLWELWYQQKFLEEDRLDIKIGQQSLDQEFIVSNNAAYFVNTAFGWPEVPSADLPGGGPAYPLSSLGVRVRARPIDEIAVLVGVFNGSPDWVNDGDPQQENPSGTSFPLNGGALAILEVQYAYPALGGMVYPGESEPLSRLYRLGVWYDTERFADQRFDLAGLSLANPASAGLARQHRGNYSIYAVADQMIWRSETDPNRTLSVFGRIMGAPEGARNLIDFSMNAGLVLHAPLPYRTTDTAGLGMGYTHVSSQVAALDRDSAGYSSDLVPVRGGEAYVEITYQYQVRPWLQLQPDLQYIFNPGGGVANPEEPGATVKDEAVLGLRTTVFF